MFSCDFENPDFIGVRDLFDNLGLIDGLWSDFQYRMDEKGYFKKIIFMKNFQSVSTSNPKLFFYAEIVEKYSNCFHCEFQKNIILAKF